jgi:hypothetical protein
MMLLRLDLLFLMDRRLAGSACQVDKICEFCHRATRSRIADYFAAHNSSYGAIHKSSPHIREDPDISAIVPAGLVNFLLTGV